MVDRACAIGKRFQRDTNFVEQCEMQIRKWRRCLELNVFSATVLSRSSTRHQNGKIGMIVRVWISHTATVQKEGMI